jgi:hypothetical protein
MTRLLSQLCGCVLSQNGFSLLQGTRRRSGGWCSAACECQPIWTQRVD